MKLPELLTYQDIAMRWRVSVSTVKRWVKFAECQKLIKPKRPTNRTVRFDLDDLGRMELSRFKAKADAADVLVPAKIPAKKDRKSQTRQNGIRRKTVPKRPKRVD